MVMAEVRENRFQVFYHRKGFCPDYQGLNWTRGEALKAIAQNVTEIGLDLFLSGEAHIGLRDEVTDTTTVLVGPQSLWG